MSEGEREVERSETSKGERRPRGPTSGRPSGMRTATARRDHRERIGPANGVLASEASEGSAERST
jgi:hypothetical protein